MCGILGVLQLDAPVDQTALDEGRDVLRHRGPGGHGDWQCSMRVGDSTLHVAMAHRRLSILDLTERADQPLILTGLGNVVPARHASSDDAAHVLIFNGEIYNYVELRQELRSRGHVFRSTGDTEVLLRAYAEWGESCVPRLNGMFAFAIWDHARSILFCARDRFGEKPLYWILDDTSRTFVFASEVKALVAAGFAQPEYDERAVYRFLRYREQGGVERSVWRGVRRLMPGHTLTASLDHQRVQLQTRQYWSIRTDPTFSDTFADAAAGFRELFRDSTRIRLRSDVPVGTSLSGGLDSSSVLCEIHQLGAAAGQRAFTARMADPALDEGHYVDLVLKRTGVTGVSVVPAPQEFIDRFDHLCAHQEEPFSSTSIFASYLVHALAAEHGVVVMLDGQGADEYLAGYGHYAALRLRDLVRRGRLVRWWNERRSVRDWRGVDPIPPRALLFHWQQRGTDNTMAIDDDVGGALLTADAHARFGAEGPRRLPVGEDALRTRLLADLTMGHLQELLRYADRNSMAWSREVRLPFLDHRLVEFCFALPTAYVLQGGESKRVLRRAMRGTVPDEILNRRDKVGFQAPWQAWWSGAMAEDLHERLSAALDELEGFVERSQIVPGSADALAVMTLAQSRSALRSLAPVRRAVGAPSGR